MILSCNHIAKSYGVETILEDVSFFVNEGEKVAVVGMNGAGKSTVLKIINGELTPDGGEVYVSKDTTMGYLAQYDAVSCGSTIYKEVESAKQDLIDMENNLRAMEGKMSSLKPEEMDRFMQQYHQLNDDFDAAGGYTFRGEIVGVIRGLGFTDEEFDKPIEELSGGQKTRVGLAKLLVSNPDILMLDEPTNHLDIRSIEWLEGFLRSYKKTVMIVSHDRYFLDKIVSKVVEIEYKKAVTYKGTYSDFSRKKEEQRKIYMKHYLEQQAEIKHEKQVIDTYRSFKTEAALIKAKSREKRLDMIEVLDKPIEIRDDMHLKLEASVESGKDVLYAEHLSKAYDDKVLFSDIGLDIKKGERVAIIGDNGTGKTTLLKIINGLIQADQGEFKLGSKVSIGYYDQEQQFLSEDKTLFDEIGDNHYEMTNTRIRTVLGAFLFTDDDVFKKIGDLSGGERGRVSLAKLMLSKANLLILDEPTNHLDITSKEILESALCSYTGTVLFVSHDRYFINRVASRILELKDHKLHNYLGNYDYYLEKVAEKQEEVQQEQIRSEGDAKAQSTGQLDWQEQKAKAAAKRKLENAIAKVEEEIGDLEDKLSAVDEKLMDPANATNSAKLNKLTAKRNEIEEKLEPLYEKWEELTSEE
ncbi:MAG: ABC-F family ATP-binding cassette domain-containing protein [Lachnospiraceae bacterium]|nr:ABC-F family ATP-binding cassette domain-containing protein [Lachnospiraceae bacterium]